MVGLREAAERAAQVVELLLVVEGDVGAAASVAMVPYSLGGIRRYFLPKPAPALNCSVHLAILRRYSKILQ